MRNVQKVMRMLALYEHKVFKVVTLHSDIKYIHAAIKIKSFNLIR